MEIKRATDSDITSLLTLYKELVHYDNSAEVSKQILEKINADDNYRLLVACENDKVVGSLLGICCYDLCCQGRPFLVVESVIVSEGCRGKGIATALMNEIESFAHSRNCAYSILVSSAFRKGAHSFYEEMGYNDDVIGFRKMYE